MCMPAPPLSCQRSALVCSSGRFASSATQSMSSDGCNSLNPSLGLDQACIQAVLCQAFCLIFSHAQVGVQRMEVFGHVATEVGRVVRVDGDFHAALEHVEDVVLGHVVEHAELGVGQRADGQRDLFVDDALHQSLVFNGAYTVVDALDLQQVQCFPDVFRRAFFSGVGDGQEALAAGAIKYALELAWRVAHLGAIEAHGDERITERQRLIEGFSASSWDR